MSDNDTSKALRQAAALGDIGSEETMYPILVEVLNRLFPTGFEARSHASNEEGRPDISIVRTLSGAKAAEAAPVAHIEVKHAATLASAVALDDWGEHQIARYRRSGLPVLLTDSLRWFDVTDRDDLSLPVARFGDDCNPAAAEQQLRSLLHIVCQRRPRYTTSSAVDAMAGIVAQIDASVDDNLADSWQVVRTALGFGYGETLDDGERGIGEIIAFTLLSIAVHLPALPDDEFMPAATAEWEQEGTWSESENLPSVMQAALEQFRLHLKAKQAFGAAGWPTIRGLAAYPDYWTEGTVCAATLAHHTVEIPLAEDPDAVLDLVDIGRDLVVIWSADELPAGEFDGQPGAWRFDGHNDLAGTKINGRDVLKKWREARPGNWSEDTAAEYARTVLALTMLLEARDKVGALLD